MGHEAVRLLIDLIDDPAQAPTQVTLADRLVVRGSCRRVGGGAVTDRSRSTSRPTADPRRPIDERVEDLLAPHDARGEGRAARQRLGLPARATAAELSARAGAALLRHGLGQVTRVSGASSLRAARGGRARQRDPAPSLEETRLGIPAIVHEEICSGLMAREATVFPQAIGLASTWEPELVEAMARRRARRRCGRSARTRASRPCSTSAAIRAGAAPRRRSARTRTSSRRWASPSCAASRATTCATGVVATAKHFVGYGASEGGMNWAPAHIGRARAARRLPASRSRRRSAPPALQSVMNAYNELDGMPCARRPRAARPTLLRDAVGLRRLRRLRLLLGAAARTTYHRLAAGRRSRPRRWRSTPGIDVELPSTDCYGAPLLRGARRGLVADERSTTRSRRVLRDEVRARAVRAAVRRRRGRRRRGRHAGAARRSRGRSRARASCSCRTTARCRCSPGAASVAVIGPNADDARDTCFGDYATPRTSSRCSRCCASGRNVFSMRDRPTASRSAPRCPPAPTVLRRAARAASASRRQLRRGLRRDRARPATASTRPSRWPRRRTSRCW